MKMERRTKMYDIFIGLRSCGLSYVETIAAKNALVADTHAYDIALDKYGENADIKWCAIPAGNYYPEQEGDR